MSDSFDLNDLLLDIFPELASYIRPSTEDDEYFASIYEVTVDYYRMEFKLN
jgi:hypothetical protein